MLSLITSVEVTSIVFVFILLFCSALISGAEIAFFSLTLSDFDEDNGNEPSKKMQLVQKLLRKPKKLLATILVANNLINIAIVLLFASLSELFFGGINSPEIKFILDVVVVTFFILLFGEILPKVYASRNRISFASFMAYPLNVLYTLFSPISTPMRSATIYIENKFGKQKSNISVDQLSQALELTSEEDTTHEEQKILQGIVTFGNTDKWKRVLGSYGYHGRVLGG